MADKPTLDECIRWLGPVSGDRGDGWEITGKGRRERVFQVATIAHLRTHAALVERARRLTEALIRAAEQFEGYADEHQAKGSIEKASRNLERAIACRRAAALEGDRHE